MYKIATTTISQSSNKEIQARLEFEKDYSLDEIIENATRGSVSASIQKSDRIVFIAADYQSYYDYVLITKIGG